ncbi:MAG TPA: ABC transporter permease [Caulobacteraceae bacterium]|nr:ABC transporter permease [Caulobacteraceae bacterium]
MRRLGDIAAPLALLAALCLGWEAACRLLRVPVYFLPPPSAVLAALWSRAPLLLESALNTLEMALLGLACASLIAMAVALAAGLHRLLESAVRPLAVALQVTPVVAIAPLVSIWAGIDHPERAVIGLAVVVAFFPILSGAMTGLKAVDPDLQRLFRLYGAGRLQTLFGLQLPSAAPFVVEGHRVAAGLAVIGAVVAEFVAGSGGTQGLAWRILEAGNRLRTAEMFAALLMLAILGLVVHWAMAAAEAWILRRWGAR